MNADLIALIIINPLLAEKSSVPPAAIGALVAAAVLVSAFVCIKVALAQYRKRRYGSRAPSGGHAADFRPRDDTIDHEAFYPPPTYAECVDNPLYMPQDAFKPPDTPGSSVQDTAPSSSVWATSTSGSGQPQPAGLPTYDRVLSGEFKELNTIERKRVAKGLPVFTDQSQFSIESLPRELRGHARAASHGNSHVTQDCDHVINESIPANHEGDDMETRDHPHHGDSNHDNNSEPEEEVHLSQTETVTLHQDATPHSTPEQSQCDMSQQPFQFVPQENPAFTDSEFNDILSAMQDSEHCDNFPDSNTPTTADDIIAIAQSVIDNANTTGDIPTNHSDQIFQTPIISSMPTFENLAFLSDEEVSPSDNSMSDNSPRILPDENPEHIPYDTNTVPLDSQSPSLMPSAPSQMPIAPPELPKTPPQMPHSPPGRWPTTEELPETLPEMPQNHSEMPNKPPEMQRQLPELPLTPPGTPHPPSINIINSGNGYNNAAFNCDDEIPGVHSDSHNDTAQDLQSDEHSSQGTPHNQHVFQLQNDLNDLSETCV